MTTESTETTECCKSTESDDTNSCCKSCPQANLGLIYGSLLLRLWLGVRAIQTGVEKFVGMKGSDQPISLDGKVNDYGLTSATNVKEYALSHYHGVPEALTAKFTAEPLMRIPEELYRMFGGKVKGVSLSDTTAASTAAWAKFIEKPMMLTVYDMVLGPALLLLGLTILLGIASRTSLFVLGLIYVSLTWGLILIKEDSGVAWLGIHMIMIVMALWLSKYNRLCVLKKF